MKRLHKYMDSPETIVPLYRQESTRDRELTSFTSQSFIYKFVLALLVFADLAETKTHKDGRTPANNTTNTAKLNTRLQTERVVIHTTEVRILFTVSIDSRALLGSCLRLFCHPRYHPSFLANAFECAYLHIVICKLASIYSNVLSNI